MNKCLGHKLGLFPDQLVIYINQFLLSCVCHMHSYCSSVSYIWSDVLTLVGESSCLHISQGSSLFAGCPTFSSCLSLLAIRFLSTGHASNSTEEIIPTDPSDSLCKTQNSRCFPPQSHQASIRSSPFILAPSQWFSAASAPMAPTLQPSTLLSWSSDSCTLPRVWFE